MSEDTCRLCARVEGEEAPVGGWIVRDDDVCAYLLPDRQIPGWLMVQHRRHVEGLTEMSAREAAMTGLVTQRLAMALTAASGQDRVYGYALGERQRHYHVILGTPPAGPGHDRGRALLARVLDRDPELEDREEAVAFADRVRAHLAAGEEAYQRRCSEALGEMYAAGPEVR